MLAAQSPCKTILGCEEGKPPYAFDVANEGGLCSFCEVKSLCSVTVISIIQAAVRTIFDSVGIDDIITKGAEQIIQVCEQLGLVGDDDCKKRVMDTVKEVLHLL